MSIVINPKYSSLKLFVEQIPHTFEDTGELVYTARNQLKVFRVEGCDLIVKRYKRPHFINRFAYTFIRPSKARRAYEYALKLLQLDVQSPEPVAYIEEKKHCLLDYSYFISIYENDYTDIRELMLGTRQDPVLLQELAEYIAYFHDKGVLHLDMSPGNILYKKVGEHFSFTLIDINRMQFYPSVSNEKRFSSFKRLTQNNEVLVQMSKFYALAAGFNEEETIRQIGRYTSEFNNSHKLKRRK